MAQILLGILGVSIFIMSALAGVTYLGPVFMRSTVDSEAGVALQDLAQISIAVQLRDAELETTTPESFDLEDLAPDYLPELPENPLGSSQPRLLQITGFTGTILVMPVEGAKARALCDSLSRQGGGPEVAPHLFISQIKHPIGCIQSKKDYAGIISEDGFMAYSRV